MRSAPAYPMRGAPEEFGLSFELFISYRYLKAKRKQTFISIITAISTAGVALGVCALIVVIGVMNGFKEDLQKKILGITSHVVIMRYSGTIGDWRSVKKRAESEPGVDAATPFVYTQAMVGFKGRATGVVLRGINPETAQKVINLGKVKEGALRDLGARDAVNGIFLGVELAKRLGAEKNAIISVMSPIGKLTPMGRVPVSRDFLVMGFFETGMYEYDSNLAFISLSAAQSFVGMRDGVTGLEVKVADIYQAGKIADSLQNKLGFPYYAKDWMRMNKSLFSALKLEKLAMYIILILIVLVAAFGIISTLIMVVMEKTGDIAILMSMGATRSSIMKIFVYQGLFIGLLGSVVGTAGGIVLSGILKKYKFIKLPPDIYYIATLPVRIDPLEVALIALSAVAIALLATIYPARRASRIDPAEALRYE